MSKGPLEYWEVIAQTLPPPTDDEIKRWADGTVYHRSPDGVLLKYDSVLKRWFRADEKR